MVGFLPITIKTIPGKPFRLILAPAPLPPLDCPVCLDCRDCSISVAVPYFLTNPEQLFLFTEYQVSVFLSFSYSHSTFCSPWILAPLLQDYFGWQGCPLCCCPWVKLGKHSFKMFFVFEAQSLWLGEIPCRTIFFDFF